MELFNVPDPVLAITHEYQEVNGLTFRGYGDNLFEAGGDQGEIDSWSAATGAVVGTLEENQKVAEGKLFNEYMAMDPARDEDGSYSWSIKDDDLQGEYDTKLEEIQTATDIASVTTIVN